LLSSPPDKAALGQPLGVERVHDGVPPGRLDLSGYEDAPWTVDAVQSLLDKSFSKGR